MDQEEDGNYNTLVDYCAKQIVNNWDNRKYRGEILRQLHTYFLPRVDKFIYRANADMVDYVLNTFRTQKKVGAWFNFSV